MAPDNPVVEHLAGEDTLAGRLAEEDSQVVETSTPEGGSPWARRTLQVVGLVGQLPSSQYSRRLAPNSYREPAG